MKKILSFVLVLAMIASMMCVSVSAADNTFENNQTGALVGDATKADGSGGVNGFEAEYNSTNVTATISSKTVNKYALDLEYKISNISLSGESVWNVNTLKYDANNLEIEIDGTKTSLTAASATFQIGTIKLTNYSDLGLDVEFIIDTPLANHQTTPVPITGDVVRNNSGVDASAFDVDGVYTGAASHSAVVANYKATITSTDWPRAAAQLNTLGGQQVIATITFKVQPATEAHRSNSAQQG